MGTLRSVNTGQKQRRLYLGLQQLQKPGHGLLGCKFKTKQRTDSLSLDHLKNPRF